LTPSPRKGVIPPDAFGICPPEGAFAAHCVVKSCSSTTPMNRILQRTLYFPLRMENTGAEVFFGKENFRMSRKRGGRERSERGGELPLGGGVSRRLTEGGSRKGFAASDLLTKGKGCDWKGLL